MFAVTLLPQTEWQAIPTDTAQDEDVEESDSDEPGPAIAANRDPAEGAIETPMSSGPGAKSSSDVNKAADALEHQLLLSDAASRSAQRQGGRQQVHTFVYSTQVNVDLRVSEGFASDSDQHIEQHTRAESEQQRMTNAM